MPKIQWETGARWFLLFISLLLLISNPIMANKPVLCQGDEGPYVSYLQHLLISLDYNETMPDGAFGPRTKRSVQAMQADHGLVSDGVVGQETWRRLESLAQKGQSISYVVQAGDSLWSIARRFDVGINTLAHVNNISDPTLIRIGQRLSISTSSNSFKFVEMLPWPDVDKIFENESIATVTDVLTGIKFQVRRYYGHYHADVEPLTRNDTNALRRIYGGSWSWDRRGVIVEIKGKRIAGSINGFPHGGASIRDNGFAGHICLHFLGSKIHRTQRIDSAHQKMILMAAGYRVE